ncbi:hypothetical protein [Stenotrophomonas pictorum]|nr:hypothetical protein [Stenotrophomonas pictorum]
MSPSTDAMAVIAVDSYVDPRSRGDDETIKIDGHGFHAINHFNNPAGYQVADYQDEVTGQLVVIHSCTACDKSLIEE